MSELQVSLYLTSGKEGNQVPNLNKNDVLGGLCSRLNWSQNGIFWQTFQEQMGQPLLHFLLPHCRRLLTF